jgi:hypothetical protein
VKKTSHDSGFCELHRDSDAGAAAVLESQRELGKIPPDFMSDVKEHCKKYHEGSRQWIFDEVHKWGKSNARMFWLMGEAGMGKSVVSAKVCQELSEKQRHAADDGGGLFLACYFCRHDNALRNDPFQMIRSLSEQFAKRLPDFKRALEEGGLVERTRNVTDLNTLFDELIDSPLAQVATPTQKLIVIVDALDEAKLGERNQLLKLIADRFDKLPEWIGFLVTSRPGRCGRCCVLGYVGKGGWWCVCIGGVVGVICDMCGRS